MAARLALDEVVGVRVPRPQLLNAVFCPHRLQESGPSRGCPERLLLSPRMRIVVRLLPFVALLALALPVAGCGGGGGDESTAAPVETTEETTALTKAELISQGDGICAEVNAAVGTVGSTSSAAGGEAAQV